MKQTTLAAAGFEKHGRATRKAEFLSRMEALMPWAEFCALIEPHYPKADNGRPPVSLERMLRMYCIANGFSRADEACEEALYDTPVFREFCRIDLGRERVPDATTLLHFRHLFEAHQLGTALFAKVGELLMQNGMRLSGGKIVDATLIAAPPSVKNQDKARDPAQIRVQKMHQVKKGNQWHFLNPFLDTNRRAYRKAPLSEADKETNRRKFAVRSKVEHPFLTLKRLWGFAKTRYWCAMRNLSAASSHSTIS